MTLNVSPELALKMSQVEMVILDVDNTLVSASDAHFYNQYSQMVEKAIASYYAVSAEESKEIADYYRKHHGGGEQALFQGNVEVHFPKFGKRAPNFGTLYTLLNTIDPKNAFKKQTDLKTLVGELKSQGVILVALTSSPDKLSKNILIDSGYDPDKDFDLFISYTADKGPPKLLSAEKVFQEIANTFQIAPERVLAIGDSLAYDVLPAVKVGMIGCHIANAKTPGYDGLVTRKTLDIITTLITCKKGNAK